MYTDRRQGANTTLWVSVKFGKKVRKARLEKGFSQEELAHEADSNRTYISDVERGERNPSIEFVERTAEALCVKMGDLLDETADGFNVEG